MKIFGFSGVKGMSNEWFFVTTTSTVTSTKACTMEIPLPSGTTSLPREAHIFTITNVRCDAILYAHPRSA